MKKALSGFVFSLVLLPLVSCAASFDCSKAATKIEKMICEDIVVSPLDEQLSKVYKAELEKSTNKEALKQEQKVWLKTVRNKCEDYECLLQVYRLRIYALLSPNRKIFKMPGSGYKICQDYLHVLNTVPWDDLMVCKLPNLTSSPFTAVEFKPLTGASLKAMDKIVYEQAGGGPHLDWEQQWPEREKDYASGYLKLAEAYWDLDNDGQLDQIIEEQRPTWSCEMLGKGDRNKLENEVEKKWEKISKDEKLLLAKQYGFGQFYSLIKNGKLSFIDATHFVSYDNKKWSIYQRRFSARDSITTWTKDTDWASISSINPVRDDKHREYESSTECTFSLE